MADDGYIKAGKSIPAEDWLMNAGAAIAERLEISVRESDARVTHNISVTDIVTDALLGGVWRLWVHADSQIRSDNTLNLSRGGVANVMRVPVWWLDFIPEKWLRFSNDGVTTELPGYCQKNRVTGKDLRKENREIKRDQGAKRQRKYRTNKKRSNAGDAGVTHSSRRRNAPGDAPVTHPTGTGTVTGRPIPVGEGGQSSEAVTASLASANGTSRCGPITAQTRSTQTLGSAALARAAIAKLKPPAPAVKSDDEKRSDVRRLAKELPHLTHADFARMCHLSVEEVTAILATPPQPETIDGQQQT